MAVYDKAHELASELKRSEEYREYQKAKDAIMGNESALSILKDYRRHEILVQSTMLSGKEPDQAQRAEMDRLKGLVEIHGPVMRYLEAERRVFVMVSDIQRILTDALSLLEL